MTPKAQELQNWTGGTLNIIKLIGMNSRFASICIKAQEQKWSIFFCQIVQFFSHFLFLCLYADRCKPGVHSYQFYCVKSTSSPILKSLVPWGHLVGGYLSLCSVFPGTLQTPHDPSNSNGQRKMLIQISTITILFQTHKFSKHQYFVTCNKIDFMIFNNYCIDTQ